MRPALARDASPRAILRQRVHGGVAFARRVQFERCERPDGFEHAIQRTRRRIGRLGAEQQTPVNQAGHRPQRRIAPR